MHGSIHMQRTLEHDLCQLKKCKVLQTKLIGCAARTLIQRRKEAQEYIGSSTTRKMVFRRYVASKCDRDMYDAPLHRIRWFHVIVITFIWVTQGGSLGLVLGLV
jgi:hypothetical protein